MQSLADKLHIQSVSAQQLSPEQKRVQRITGALRYPEKTTPAITLLLHRLSCVAACAPPSANLVASLALELAWEHRYDGLTFGLADDRELSSLLHGHVQLDERPPQRLDATSDATWGAGIPDDVSIADLPPLASLAEHTADGSELVARDLYSQVITFNGAAVLHSVRKIGVLLDSSMGVEAHGTAKVAENNATARDTAHALGAPQDGPTRIGTDNLANMQVAMRRGAAGRSRHLLRRYYVLRQRIRDGECQVTHVPDAENPSDFLTKWVPADKLRKSLAYVCGMAPVGGKKQRKQP
jgi:hypothetical protein